MVAKNVRIGAYTILKEWVNIGENVMVGERSDIYPFIRIYDDVNETM